MKDLLPVIIFHIVLNLSIGVSRGGGRGGGVFCKIQKLVSLMFARVCGLY